MPSPFVYSVQTSGRGRPLRSSMNSISSHRALAWRRSHRSLRLSSHGVVVVGSIAEELKRGRERRLRVPTIKPLHPFGRERFLFTTLTPNTSPAQDVSLSNAKEHPDQCQTEKGRFYKLSGCVLGLLGVEGTRVALSVKIWTARWIVRRKSNARTNA